MLQELNKVERLTNKVWRILGLNPSQYTLQGTNTYLIGEGNNRLLIDTGQNMQGYKELLQGVLNQTNSQINQVLITHNHLDHVNGIIDILQLSKNCIFRKYNYNKNDQILEEKYNFKYDIKTLEDNEIIKGQDFTLKVITLPGHCPDHVGFYFQEEKTLFCGDFILSGSSGVIMNLSDQMKSYQKALSLDIENLFSAHGPAIFGNDKSVKYIIGNRSHRLKREQQIIQAAQSLKMFSNQQIRHIIYPNLQENLITGALNNIDVHLQKLIEEQVVIKKENNIYEYIGQ
ncbi:hypothetical protein IMG5_124170 [Ichthyophthirius multifiliis]|uniref:Metallo-beta-lactamase domain-containing protein n=1 Tax=Ichthyophthirius multifiliis TaxID=5932 RepID=G0QVJ1_ICHMU|nr:hypothetical protein IMG5_124170 [Ichthyophthirius multifiliis]EGR30751.1 hypothetical protein IMG5_124170 [Ichthyophthirius multifiliis]|eukprot:XP_004032338.1 hypothetical protein IMG5_124170 [Ichthyophthirius multifiliis]